MTMRFIDISNWKSDLNPDKVYPNVDAVVMKATGGTSFVDKYCDGFVQAAKRLGKPWGFYHYAHDVSHSGSAVEEAEFFYKNCLNYFGEGIPILDWEEDSCSVDWVNTFVEKIHEWTGVWCWIYGNPWRFNQGGVNSECDRWVASYPNYSHPSFEVAEGWNCPSAAGSICAWQYCSDGIVDGYDGVLDCNLFYGDLVAWKSYAKGSPWSEGDSDSVPDDNSVTLEGDGYRVTVERI